MLLPRVIPLLLLQERDLVKTVGFKTPKYVGDPINAIKIFNEKEVDELILLDMSSRRAERGPDYDLIEEIASECFMPLCYGGGITQVAQAKRVMDLGVEKIAVHNALLTRPEFVRELASEIGSQSVVVSVDVKKKRWSNRYRVFDSTKRKLTNIDPIAFAETLATYGAGELLLSSVDRDGTQRGYDEELVRLFTDKLAIPVIACGGAWTNEHLHGVVRNAKASAAAAGSMFVFQGPHRAVLINYPSSAERFATSALC